MLLDQPSAAMDNDDYMKKRPRLLYLAPDISLDLPRALSRDFEGDYLTPWAKMYSADAEADRKRVERSFGSFRFVPMPPLSNRLGPRQMSLLRFFVASGEALARERGPYDAVVAYSPYTPGLAALVLKRRLAIPAIVEYPIDPTSVFRTDQRLLGPLRHWASPKYCRWLASRVDRVVLLYPQQAAAIGFAPDVATSIVHPFTRLRVEETPGAEQPVILLIGKPWRLKGADVLIRAFKRIRERFPDVTLRIAGSDEDPAPFQELGGNDPRIEFVGRLDHDVVLRELGTAAVVALASHSEGVPRVLIEAMSNGRAVVAPAVGGIPYLLRDGATGLIFPPGDDVVLAERLAELLGDPDRRADLGRRAAALIREEFAEEHVADMWREAIMRTLEPADSPRPHASLFAVHPDATSP